MELWVQYLIHHRDDSISRLRSDPSLLSKDALTTLLKTDDKSWGALLLPLNRVSLERVHVARISTSKLCYAQCQQNSRTMAADVFYVENGREGKCWVIVELSKFSTHNQYLWASDGTLQLRPLSSFVKVPTGHLRNGPGSDTAVPRLHKQPPHFSSSVTCRRRANKKYMGRWWNSALFFFFPFFFFFFLQNVNRSHFSDLFLSLAFSL